jgi:hypothetical protein
MRVTHLHHKMVYRVDFVMSNKIVVTKARDMYTSLQIRWNLIIWKSKLKI